MKRDLYEITSFVRERGKFQARWNADIIKNEPMLFNATQAFAYQNGGPITREFLASLPADWRNPDTVIDSRVHMLMPGWFPCIPGFHHDDVPRTGPNDQPDYDTPAYRSEHLMGLVNADICPTQFALGECFLPGVPDNDVVYRVWHQQVEALLRNGCLTSMEAQSGTLIEFNDRAFHQGVRARASGWRWFIRMSRNTDRTRSQTNEIRRQVQVYLDFPMQGW